MGRPDEFGKLLRQWRQHRRLSQLALANNAEISTKHLSFLETGRAAPSRDMIPEDVTVSELSIECLFPADTDSAKTLHDLVLDT